MAAKCAKEGFRPGLQDFYTKNKSKRDGLIITAEQHLTIIAAT